jgi:peptidoglycan hydrolase-like protein with peptidoglycan-binding domain
MRWFSIIASLALACAPSVGAMPPQPSPQASTAQTGTSTAPSKPVSHKKKHHAKREPTQKAPTADRISEIQSALVRGGYYQGSPNGKWDSNTVAAVQKFQSANGIEANGKLDAPTLQKLGLGSGIAGVSAPKAAAPPSSQNSPPAKVPGTTAANEPVRQN